MTTTTAPRFVIECGKSIAFGITDEMLAQLGQHQAAFDHVLMIGLKNLVQDSHASIKQEDFASEDEWKAAARARAEIKLGAILSGDVRVSRATGTPKLSDFDAFARKWIIAKAKAKIGTADWKVKTEGDSGAEFIDGLVEKNFAKFEAAIRVDYAEELAKRERAAKLADDFEI